MGPRSLCDIPRQLLAEYRKSDQLLYKEAGEWRAISTQEFCARIRYLALGLRRLGVTPGDRVAILSENRPEWTVTDFAILEAGAVTVPIYTSLLPEQMRFILHDSGARAIVVSRPDHLASVLEVRGRLEALGEVVVMDPDGPPPAGVRTWAEVWESGRQEVEHDPKAGVGDLGSARREDLASIIYTSGTTGFPKGVMLTHGNFTHNVTACCAAVPFVSSDLCLSFLPLAHVYERMVEYCYLYRGASIAYAESIDTLVPNLVEIGATIACGVPRLFEKIHRRILDTAADLPLLRRTIFFWALAVARRVAAVHGPGGGGGPLLRAQQHLADRLVYAPLRARLGGKLRFFVSGSAPLSREIAEFFHGVGIVILEGYGMTETSPVITVNRIDSVCFGGVGRPINGVQVRIAEDGEILTRSPSVMKGYYNNEPATREVLKDGWLQTGDVGHIDAHNCLVITDRKKEILKTSGGKIVAPQPIENLLRSDRFIAQAMVVGDRRRFISALIVPDFEQIRSYVRVKEIPEKPMPELLRRPPIVDLFERRIARVNERLARYERIRKFAILDREFREETGEITPTLKLRRKQIEKIYVDRIEELYREA